jgi:hypothetical protein
VPQWQRRAHHLRAEVRQRRRGADDIGDSIDGAYLVEGDRLERRAMNEGFGLG